MDGVAKDLMRDLTRERKRSAEMADLLAEVLELRQAHDVPPGVCDCWDCRAHEAVAKAVLGE